MARSIVAVIVSYVVMFVLNFLGFVGLYALVGPNNAFRPRSYLASNRWIAMSFALSFVTAIIGGLICAAIARGGKSPLALAIVVLVLGLLLAIPAVVKHQNNAGLIRQGDVSQLEAARLAHWPVWVPFAFPIIGAVGVLIGGKLKRRG
jgi:hypothetical protein